MTNALRRLATRQEPEPVPQEERCEFCGTDLGERHGHVADLVDHRLLCACRPCYLVFAPEGAGGARYRGVGERVQRVDELDLSTAQWDGLRVPVDLAFFFRQTSVERLLAFYPGPGGATESELDLSAWSDIEAANPVIGTVAADVEAVLLRRHDGRFSCYVVPIDTCYELVGIVRATWRGLGGGAEVWEQIGAYFAELDRRSVPVPASGGAS